MSWSELPTTLDVGPEDRGRRVERRLGAVLRQLEQRIAELDRQRSEIAALRADVERHRAEAERWRGEHEALMATKTMRALRLPRSLYSRFRRG